MISERMYRRNAKELKLQQEKRAYYRREKQESPRRFMEITHPERRQKKA